MPISLCFSYPGNVSPGQREPTTSACFSYSPDVPPAAGDLGAVQPTLLGTRRMPLTCYSYPFSCFSYPDDMPSAIGNREAAQAVLPGLRRMPYGTCFRY